MIKRRTIVASQERWESEKGLNELLNVKAMRRANNRERIKKIERRGKRRYQKKEERIRKRR